MPRYLRKRPPVHTLDMLMVVVLVITPTKRVSVSHLFLTKKKCSPTLFGKRGVGDTWKYPPSHRDDWMGGVGSLQLRWLATTLSHAPHYAQGAYRSNTRSEDRAPDPAQLYSLEDNFLHYGLVIRPLLFDSDVVAEDLLGKCIYGVISMIFIQVGDIVVVILIQMWFN